MSTVQGSWGLRYWTQLESRTKSEKHTSKPTLVGLGPHDEKPVSELLLSLTKGKYELCLLESLWRSQEAEEAYCSRMVACELLGMGSPGATVALAKRDR